MHPSVSLLQIDGVDARSLAEIKRRRTCCTLSIYFGVATTQMRRIFAKVSYNFDRGISSGAVFSPSIAENSLSSFFPLEDIRVGIFMMTLR